MKLALIFCLFVCGCKSVADSAGNGRADIIAKVGKLRRGMNHSQVHEVLKPVKEQPGVNISGIGSTWYWLSSDCGLWLEYGPGDKLIRFDSIEVSMRDNQTKQWGKIEVSKSE